MARTAMLQNRTRVNVWLPTALTEELNKVISITQQTQTDAITEALQYWLNAQKDMIEASGKGGA